MADVFHMPWHRRFVYIWLPAVRPYLTSACASALGMSWKAGVAAEVIGLPQGSMGEALYDAKIFFNTTDLLAWTVIIVVVSVLFERLFMALLKFGFGRLVRL
jgi:NitT/TauT family transport system permease protein